MNEVLVVVVVAVLGAVAGASLAYAWSQRPSVSRSSARPFPRPAANAYGAPLPPLVAPARSAAPARSRPPAPRRATLLRGADEITVVTVSGLTATVRSGTIVGRSSGCGVHLPSAEVSRRHAILYNAGGTWFVGDLGSTNGTVVDGVRVRGAAPLRDGALVWLGGRRGVGLVVRRPGPTVEPPTVEPHGAEAASDDSATGTKVLETSRG